MMRWKVLHSSYAFTCPWLKVRKDHIQQPSGVELEDFYVVEIHDWVNVIAITEDNLFVIEEQYRHGVQQVCFELPAGEIEPEEDLLHAAQRELLEETGYTSDEWEAFGNYVPNASGNSNRCYTFIARNVHKVAQQKLEQSEDIRLHLKTKQQLIDIMEQGQMPEAVMQAPLWRLFKEII